jgi:hypothetical protein
LSGTRITTSTQWTHDARTKVDPSSRATSRTWAANCMSSVHGITSTSTSRQAFPLLASRYFLTFWFGQISNFVFKFLNLSKKQQVYQTRIENGELYINTPLALSLAKSDSFEVKVANTSSSTEQEPVQEVVTSNVKKQPEQNGEEKTLSYWAVKVLNTADPHEKAELTDRVAEMWTKNELSAGFGSTLPPDQPRRLDSLNVVDPAKIRRGKAGTMVELNTSTWITLTRSYFIIFILRAAE